MATRTFDALDQESRIARAFQQSGDYTFTAHDGDTWICEGPRGSYLVSSEQCSCEDHQYRCANAGAVCKHQWLLGRLLLELGGAPAPPEEGVCQRCGVVEPVQTMVALDDVGGHACRECYQGREERAPSRKPMTEREQAAFDRIFG
jgi:hypothetical protein